MYVDPIRESGAAADTTWLDATPAKQATFTEHYAPFDVDVTLQEPQADAITRSSSTDVTYGTRALITYSTTKCSNRKTLYASVCNGGCGGVAYVGVFAQFGSRQSRTRLATTWGSATTAQRRSGTTRATGVGRRS